MLEDYLSYNSNTGDIVWIKNPGTNSIKIGNKAGRVITDGYIQISFRKVLYTAHRLAWFLHYGVWPDGELDHINRERSDNRIENLRIVSHKENMENSSKFNLGASYHQKRKKWASVLNRKHLGYFNSEEEAQKAYKLASEIENEKFMGL